MIWAALAKWLGLGLAALAGMTGWAWVIRRDAKADARQQTALQAAEQQDKMHKRIEHADIGLGASDSERIKRLHDFATK